MALSSLSADSVNRISSSATTLSANSSASEYLKHEICSAKAPDYLNPPREQYRGLESVKSYQSLSPFKGLSPRKADRSHPKRFSIFDEHSNDMSANDSSHCGKVSMELSKVLKTTDQPTTQEAPDPLAQSTKQQNPSKAVGETGEALQKAADIGLNRKSTTQSTLSDVTSFSNFSAIPKAGTAEIASLKRSPTPTVEAFETPQQTVFTTPTTSRRSIGDSMSQLSSLSRRDISDYHDPETTNLLLDFTQQFDSHESGYTRERQNPKTPSKFTTEPNLLFYTSQKRTPSPKKMTLARNTGRQSLINLLDFDLPPQPTPRSLPSITVRELESLKSRYLSEISHLKACLSRREAEVKSLKRAVDDAEHRVAEVQENLRNEKSARQDTELEKSEWIKKGREAEALLKTMKAEFMSGEKEKEELTRKLEESTRLREKADSRASEIIRMAAADHDVATKGEPPIEAERLTASATAQYSARNLDERLESLAHELHAVYKRKHESKVATLKKTYEARTEKKVQEMQKIVDDLLKQNGQLQMNKHGVCFGMSPTESSTERTAHARRLDEQSAELLSRNAVIQRLKEDIKAAGDARAELREELEVERLEKGELVAAVDELLALQGEIGTADVIDNLKKSVNRPSGLRGPRFSDSRRARSYAHGITRGSMLVKSKMMSNIERMGGRVLERDN